jgi:sporulation protein YlmC with PRC-barrel domain
MEDHRKVYRLHDLSDYKVASHYADVRGWKLIDADNRTIGTIHDLLINKAEERVVYLEVDVDKDLLDSHLNSIHGHNEKDDTHIIVPIGAVSIHTDHKHVVCNKIDYETFRKIRRFKKGTNINRDYEISAFHSYFPDEERYGQRDDESFYSRSQFTRRD